VPDAPVLIGGDKLWPDKLARKFNCCARAGTNINETPSTQSKIIDRFLNLSRNGKGFNFRYI
jgi:hypothetical protein